MAADAETTFPTRANAIANLACSSDLRIDEDAAACILIALPHLADLIQIRAVEGLGDALVFIAPAYEANKTRLAVLVRRVDVPIAVVILSIAEQRRAGIDVGIQIIAVDQRRIRAPILEIGPANGEAVPVHVEDAAGTAVNQAVAVRIGTIADLLCFRISVTLVLAAGVWISIEIVEPRQAVAERALARIGIADALDVWGPIAHVSTPPTVVGRGSIHVRIDGAITVVVLPVAGNAVDLRRKHLTLAWPPHPVLGASLGSRPAPSNIEGTLGPLVAGPLLSSLALGGRQKDDRRRTLDGAAIQGDGDRRFPRHRRPDAPCSDAIGVGGARGLLHDVRLFPIGDDLYRLPDKRRVLLR